MKNLTNGLIAVALIILVGLACSNSDSKKTDNAPANKSGDNSNDNKSTSSSGSNTSVNSAKLPTSDITGTYDVNGKNYSGQAYGGDLTVKKQGDVYQFSWNSNGHTYDGVGIQGGNVVAAGFTTGSDGKGCGAAVYKISNNSLDGNLASWGFNTTSEQTAQLINETKTSGTFDLQGTDTDGTPYKEKLTINQNGDVYQLSYGSGNAVFHGTGIRDGDYLAVGVGKPTCGFAVYELTNGNLQGIWGGIGSSKVGTEKATRK